MKRQHVQKFRKPMTQTNKAPMRVEDLEPRVYMSCGVALVGNALTITGDAQANEIRILDDGNANVEVTCDGATNSYNTVQSVKVKTGGSRDTVSYELTGDLMTKRVITADLGRGNDMFALILNRRTPPPSVPEAPPPDSQVGSSDVPVTPPDTPVAAPEPPVASPRKITGNLTASIKGGLGSDSIAVEATDIILTGGKVKVTITSDVTDTVHFDGNLAQGSMGSFAINKIRLDGIGLASLLVNTKRKQQLLGPAMLNLESDQGSDTCQFTAGLVTATGCTVQVP